MESAILTKENMPSLNEQLERLGSYYVRDYLQDPSQAQISLLGGRGGSILVQYLFYKHTGDKQYLERIEKDLDFIMYKLSQDENIMYTFCDGLAGVGWLCLFLSEQQVLDIDLDEFFEEIDEALVEHAAIFASDKYYDQMHGLLGIGLYFLKRGNVEEVMKIFRVIDEHGHWYEDKVCWERFDRYYKSTYVYDLGLAHGQAGVLYFLMKCYEKDICQNRCRELILASFRFYEYAEQDHASIGSFFGDSIIVEALKNNTIRPSRSRLAWCYGDLGILHSLLMIALKIGETTYAGKYERMLAEVAGRIDNDRNLVRDAQFCHGASGIGYIFLNAYRMTGNEHFLNATQHWLDQCLSMGGNDSPTAGYTFRAGSEGFVPDGTLLGGIAGLTAFLLSYSAHSPETNWAECFFLS